MPKLPEPDPMSVMCPRCQETNFYIRSDKPPIINVRYVEDERGPHYECNTCSAESSIAQATKWSREPRQQAMDDEDGHKVGFRF